MTFALAFYETADEFGQRDTADAPAYWQGWTAYIDLLDEAGVLVRGVGVGLQPPCTATKVRIRAGESVIEDGPIIDTKEQLGGIVAIEVASLDDAIQWASKAPCASGGGVEIRPVLTPPSE